MHNSSPPLASVVLLVKSRLNLSSDHIEASPNIRTKATSKPTGIFIFKALMLRYVVTKKAAKKSKNKRIKIAKK